MKVTFVCYLILIAIANQPNCTLGNASEKVQLSLKIFQQLMSLTVIITCYFIREHLTNTMNLYLEIDHILKKYKATFNYRYLIEEVLTLQRLYSVTRLKISGLQK